MQADFDGTSGIFPSDVQAAILKLKNSGELGRGKKFTRRGREKEKLGKENSRSNSPSLQRIQNGGKTLERPAKPPALQATVTEVSAA